VKEAKVNLQVKQNKLFKMENSEDIETMFSRFQTSVSSVQVLMKSNTARDHVKNNLRSLLLRLRPKVTAIKEAKDLNSVCLATLASSLKSREMGLSEDGPSKKKVF
jgi:hypothetical protein